MKRTMEHQTRTESKPGTYIGRSEDGGPNIFTIDTDGNPVKVEEKKPSTESQRFEVPKGYEMVKAGERRQVEEPEKFEVPKGYEMVKAGERRQVEEPEKFEVPKGYELVKSTTETPRIGVRRLTVESEEPRGRTGELRPVTEGGPETDGKLVELYQKVNVADYVGSVTQSRAVTGAAAELQEHLGLTTGGSSIDMPLDVMLGGPLGRGRSLVGPEAEQQVQDGLQSRADAVSTFDANAGPVMEGAYLPAVFPTSLTARLAMIYMLGMGEAVHITMETSADPAVVAVDTDQDAVAAVWGVKVASPARLTATFIYRLEDVARLSMVEPRLRMDLGSALESKMNQLVVAGGSVELTSNGIMPTLGATERTDIANFVDPAAATEAQRRAAYTAIVGAMFDGLYSEAVSDSETFLSVPMYQALLGTGHPDTEKLFLEQLKAAGATVRGSRHVGTADLANDVLVGLVARQRGMSGATIVTIWPTLNLTRDNITKVREGQIVLTATMMLDITVQRKANYNVLRLHT